MTIRTVLFLCLIFSSAYAAEVRQPRPKIELGDVTLRDGRTLEGARLLGGSSGRRLNIAHKGGIEQVPIESFGDEFIAAHRDLIQEAREEYLSESEIRAKAKSAQLLEKNRKETERKLAMGQAADREREARERSRKDIAAAEKQLREREERAAKIAASKAAELARSRDGLIFDSLTRYYEGCLLVIRNVHENPRRLDWRELRARKADGRIVIPVNCESDNDRDRSLDIHSGERRAFRIRFMGGNDDVEAITWENGGQEIEPYRPTQRSAAETAAATVP